MTFPSKKVQRFLSLKWKALLFFSLVLLVINASFPFFSHQNLMKHFDTRREEAHAHYTEEFNGLLAHTIKRLQQFGGVIPALEGVKPALATAEKEALILAFEDHWPVLQLDMGIDLVRFYSKAGVELGRWGDPALIAGEEHEITSWMTSVIENERPITALSCKVICTQYVMAPILGGGKNIGAILLGASLAEVIVNFQQMSGYDVGVIVDGNESDVPDAVEQKEIARPIRPWGKHVVALTSKELILPLLQAVALKTPSFDEIKQGGNVLFESKRYGVDVIALRGLSNPGSGHLVVVVDVSENLREIRKATRQSLIAGILGLILSEALLLGILWTPMSRLRLITKTLPLLAKSAFREVRTAVGQRKKGWTDDEIDILDDTAITLSYQLEELEAEVKKRTTALAARMEELANEKDFIAHLLDTARVVILTQDQQGKVMMINQYSSYLTGYKSADLLGKQFLELLSEEDLTTEVTRDLKDLRLGIKEYLSHESVMVCKNRPSCHIIWFHSRLARRGENEPVILSVGLDLTARKQAELQLSWLADHDPLTGLFNRRRFQSELDRIFAESVRFGRTGALLFFDLDQFKYVNDTRGHHAGDALLKVVASQLSRLVRSTDIISRLGGDEFGIVISEADQAGAVHVANKLIEYLGDVEVPVLGHAYKVSASIGIALFPEHAGNVQELLSNSDLAMYQAKEKGRGTWHLFTGDEPIKTRMKEQVYWKDKIKQALDRDLFEMHYQPVQEIATGAVFYYEALIRMRDEDNRLILPGAFIPVAEQCGLIHEIDHLVINKVISLQAALAAEGRDISFTLNLSGYAFNDPAILPHLKKTLYETGANPKNIVIEITETAAVSDLVVACSLMNEIKDLGCRFALDDFGTGFSSFSYLKQLPVDIVKIGDIFIKDISAHPDDQIFVKSLLEVTKSLGKKTIAEGVEDAVTLALLREYAVDFAQGWHIGRPSTQILEA
ncbi:MAG: EAL domain-containing protein [Nitrospiria bacterium]